jgi:hypothetical protein
MKNVIVYLLIYCVTMAGCAGRDANPIPVYLPGDESRSCKGYQAETSRLNADMVILNPNTNKFAYNAVMATLGVFLIFPFFFMDMKEAEKIEWNAMRQRYNRLMIYAAEKECNFFATTDLPERIMSLDEANEAVKKAKEAEKKKK